MANRVNEIIVFVDADNTLWDTNQVYADAQLRLLNDVEIATGHHASTADQLGWLRQIDQVLAQRHHAKLRYPPRLLAKAIALALKGTDVATAARFAWSGGAATIQLDDDTAKRIEDSFLTRLEALPALRSGVAQGLRALHDANCAIFVLTEGDRRKVLSVLEHYGLAAMVTRVIEARKERKLFQRVVALTHRHFKAFMIGDQLDRDIAPAKAAGLVTIYFPGGFQPKWHPDEADVQPDYRVQDFNQAADLILNARTNVIARIASA